MLRLRSVFIAHQPLSETLETAMRYLGDRTPFACMLSGRNRQHRYMDAYIGVKPVEHANAFSQPVPLTREWLHAEGRL